MTTLPPVPRFFQQAPPSVPPAANEGAPPESPPPDKKQKRSPSPRGDGYADAADAVSLMTERDTTLFRVEEEKSELCQEWKSVTDHCEAVLSKLSKLEVECNRKDGAFSAPSRQVVVQ